MHSVLLYHTISSPPRPLPANIDVSPERFESHLRWLSRQCQVGTLDEALGASGRRKLVAVTFDDGYRDTLTVALPLMEKFSLPLAVFVTVEYLGRDGYLSAEDLRALASHPLVTIGAHGLWHHPFTQLTLDEARFELITSRRRLEAITGREVDLMAWPYGSCNPALERLSAECGYRAAWSVWHGANTRYSLWRVPLSRQDNLIRLIAKLSGAYFSVKRRMRPPK